MFNALPGLVAGVDTRALVTFRDRLTPSIPRVPGAPQPARLPKAKAFTDTTKDERND